MNLFRRETSPVVQFGIAYVRVVVWSEARRPVVTAATLQGSCVAGVDSGSIRRREDDMDASSAWSIDATGLWKALAIGANQPAHPSYCPAGPVSGIIWTSVTWQSTSSDQPMQRKARRSALAFH